MSAARRMAYPEDLRVRLTPAELAEVDRQAGGERSAWVRERLGFPR